MSSRIIVKNLPKYITEDRLKLHFESQGQISDLKLLKTSDGRSRRFAYVGYQTEKQALAAIRYFNNSFIDTSKISVEIAKARSDPSIPRPWSKYSEGSSSHQRRLTESDTAAQLADLKAEKDAEINNVRDEIEKKKKALMRIYNDKDDAELQAYLDAMRSKSQVKTWENEGLISVADSTAVKKDTKKKGPKVKVDSVIDKTSSGKGTPLARAHVVFDGENESDSEDYEDYSKLETTKGSAESIDSSVDESLSNLENSKDNETPTPTGSLMNTASFDSLIGENGRLFIRNLSYNCTEKDLTELFSPYGQIASVHIPISTETKRSKGFAFILFVFPEHALKAFTSLDGSIFQGRLLHILPAYDAPSPTDSSESGSFKQQRESKQKLAANSQHNWNSLFLNPNAITDAIARDLNLSKNEILNPEAESLATRIALAETKIIHETKAYLEEEGVILDSLNASGSATKERSDSIFLIKNIPFDTTISELENIFSRYGSIVRTILPPSKTIALIEFTTAQEARNAFKNLAYSKFKSVPLYLEWAPIGILKPRSVKIVPEEEKNMEADSSTIPNVSIFVKNLSFESKESDLESLFKPLGGVLSVKIATKPDPKNKSQRLSMGFGFVEFQNIDSAKKAIDSLQGAILDGHALQLKFSKTNSRSEVASAISPSSASDTTGTSSTKIIVRNIPFEATLNEVKTLFKSFAQVKKVRLPKKFDGNHRGFGFIEFLSKTDAKKACEMLEHTHLYGRHLVIEWAKEDNSVEELREKAKRQIDALESVEGKKKKEKKIDDELMTIRNSDDEELNEIYDM